MVSKVPKFSVSHHKSQRNAFDLSQSHLFQASPGQLLPIMNLDLIPEDDVEIHVNDFVKSMPIVQAPFCSARGVYEFFFVPYHQLWHNFDQFITQMNDYRSSYFSLDNPPSSVPSFGVVEQSDTGETIHPLSPYSFAKYGYGVGSKTDVFGKSVLLGGSVLYDLLGYGPFADPNSSTGSFEGVKYTKTIGSSNYVMYPADYSVNPFKLAAYQKIYQDYYRKSSYEVFDVNSYSLDNLVTSQIPKLVELHYRNYGLDLLNNLRPSATLNVNNQSVFNNLVPSMFGTDVVTQASAGAMTAVYSNRGAYPSSSSNSDVTSFGVETNSLQRISVQSIRAAFALDKLSSIIGRAEKDFKSQMQAVFGVNVTEGRDGKCIFIGGFNSDITFGEVDNTNGASYGTNYSAYGKVFSNGNGTIHFKSPEFGVLMCIYSIIPYVPYDSYYVDRFNTKLNYSDYFNPLYQRLGLQPLYRYQLNTFNYFLYSDNGFDDRDQMTNALGWQPRYSEYKTAVDRNHMAFNIDGSLASFTASRNRDLLNDATYSGGNYLSTLKLSDFKISPNVFDKVFTVDFNGNLNTYPFMNKASFNIVKVSSMDSDSLPIL